MQRIFVIAGVAFVLLYIGWLINRMWCAYRLRREYIRALNTSKDRRDGVWKEAEAIRGMVKLYMIMVCKHGPKSEEATAFRFGTDSQLMQSLHDDEAMDAFNQQADLIDQTWQRQQGFSKRRFLS